MEFLFTCENHNGKCSKMVCDAVVSLIPTEKYLVTSENCIYYLSLYYQRTHENI